MVGEVAPSLQGGETLDGERVELETMRGQPVLLLFWNVGCAGCTGRAIPFSKTLAGRFPALQIVGVHSGFGAFSTYAPETVRQVVEFLEIPYPVVLDEGDTTYRAFGAEGTPHWILIDHDGVVRKSIFGSMVGARQRLEYALLEMFQEDEF